MEEIATRIKAWRSSILPSEARRESGIYVWEIDGESYVGRSKNLHRRIREYPNNTRKLLLGFPYRKGKPSKFRMVHHALASAFQRDAQVTCSIKEVCAVEGLAERERFWIEELGTLNGKRVRKASDQAETESN